MSLPSRRQRSTTASSTPPPITESTSTLRTSLETVSQILKTPSEAQSYDISKLIVQIQISRQSLLNSPEAARAKDIFRHEHGFSILLNALRATSGYYQPAKKTQLEKEQLFELLKEILGLLSDVFRDHHGNRRYFKKRVEGGGWEALEQAIACIGFVGSESDTWGENQLFGLLLAFAVDDVDLRALCRVLENPVSSKNGPDASRSRKNSSVKGSGSQSGSSPRKPSKGLDFPMQSTLPDNAELPAYIAGKVSNILKASTLFVNVEIVPTIMSFWKALPRDRSLSEAPAPLIVILALSQISSMSNLNLLALHSTGLLSTILPFAFEEDKSLDLRERKAVENLCSSLISLGLSTLNDARYLLSGQSTKVAEFLLQATKSSQSPPHIQFDLSLNGFASIELPSLGRPFPPPSSIPGYTFTAWIYIEQFDVKEHTTIFGAFDSSQTCFVLAYLERDTHNFILQTSVTSSRPSVRFKSTAFEEKKWYHVAVVHRRPRTITSSKAALYVDGEFVEQVKCQYPVPPPPINSSTDSFASFTSSGTRLNPVQAFLGTPRDLSSKPGQGSVFTRWSLASAHLFEDVLSDDLIAVHYRLGPRYTGNFQDCLGSFQTYEASAALAMRNELMHPGKDEKSDILSAIREKASSLVPESRVLLSVLPTAILGDETRGEGSNSQLLRGLSRSASSNLVQLTRNSASSVAINVAVPSINDALTRSNGTAVLTGDPVVIVPQSLDDAMWRLGGCAAIGLKLVEEASSREEIVRAVEILFESVKGSWRNSEAMERENGYAILGALIRGKIGAGTVIASKNSVDSAATPYDLENREKLSFQLLSLVLGFVGYNHESPENSIINNPLAYRILLVDFDMWRKTAIMTQKLYYKQFITFGVRSKYHHFNGGRLLRMRMSTLLLRSWHY